MPEEQIIQKLLEHDEKLKEIHKRLDQTLTKSEFLEQFDKAMVILQRLDQERVFTIERIKRLEAEVDRIKLRLNIS